MLSAIIFKDKWFKNLTKRYSRARNIMTNQIKFTLNGFKRGIHLITNDVLGEVRNSEITLPESGIFHLFTSHCSCGLSINENCDPDVRHDMEMDFERLVPEREPYYYHTLEGSDDMPSHTKSVLVGPDITLPIVNRQIYFGTWQGIYFFEFRNNCRKRTFIATIIS